MTLMTIFLAVNAVAFLALLVMSRTSVMLVDDEGRPMVRNNAWRERVVPASAGELTAVVEVDRQHVA